MKFDTSSRNPLLVRTLGQVVDIHYCCRRFTSFPCSDIRMCCNSLDRLSPLFEQLVATRALLNGFLTCGVPLHNRASGCHVSAQMNDTDSFRVERRMSCHTSHTGGNPMALCSTGRISCPGGSCGERFDRSMPRRW